MPRKRTENKVYSFIGVKLMLKSVIRSAIRISDEALNMKTWLNISWFCPFIIAFEPAVESVESRAIPIKPIP